MATDDTPVVSYAQHGEDVVLMRAFGHQPTGWYVDVGAFDPTVDSVTRAFYERGWRGVNIDPSAEAIERFILERPEDVNLAVAAGAEDGEAVLHVTDVPGWATIDETSAAALDSAQHIVGRVTVPVRRLSRLLDELPERTIDFLKIDAEGAESEVVAGLDLERHRPRVVVLEGTAPGAGDSYADAALTALERAGYLHGCFDGLNHYLTCEPPLLAALSVPANPNDRYVKYPVAQLEMYAAHLDEVVAERTLRLDQLSAALQRAETRLADVTADLTEREESLRMVISSRSWRLTAPLRAARHLRGRLRTRRWSVVAGADRALRRAPRVRDALVGFAVRHPRSADRLRSIAQRHRSFVPPGGHVSYDATSMRRNDAVSALVERARLRTGTS
jgi:FkbM family methyltransferase